jgi:hypothetical protein
MGWYLKLFLAAPVLATCAMFASYFPLEELKLMWATVKEEEVKSEEEASSDSDSDEFHGSGDDEEDDSSSLSFRSRNVLSSRDDDDDDDSLPMKTKRVYAKFHCICGRVWTSKMAWSGGYYKQVCT